MVLFSQKVTAREARGERGGVDEVEAWSRSGTIAGRKGVRKKGLVNECWQRFRSAVEMRFFYRSCCGVFAAFRGVVGGDTVFALLITQEGMCSAWSNFVQMI